MSTTRMRLGALVTAGVLTFGLSACGGEDEPEATPVTTVDEGTDATEDTDATATATDEDTEDTTEAETTEEETDTGDASSGETIPIEEFLAMLQEPGEEVLSSYTMIMEMELEGEQTAVEGAVDLSGDSPRMQMTMVVPELGEMDMIFADGQTYMAMPGLTPEGMYLLAPEELVGDTAEFDEVDVSAQWELWEEGAQEVLFMGEEDVDGEQMRRYQVTVDAQALLDASVDDAAALEQMWAESSVEEQELACELFYEAPEELIDGFLEGSGDEFDASTVSNFYAGKCGTAPDMADATGAVSETIVYDVWLDDDNLMRKMAFDLEGETLEMFMDNWGEPQDIQVPEEDQVMDFGDLGTGPTG